MSTSIRVARADELSTIVSIDDDASRLFVQAGLAIDLADDHPYFKEERRRWSVAAAAGSAYFAVEDGTPVGVAVLYTCDGEPFLDQLSVRLASMRRGVGKTLLSHAIEWARGRTLWLTTYDHFPWNAPFYRRNGFEVVPENERGPEIRETIAQERAALPVPEARVVMRRRCSV